MIRTVRWTKSARRGLKKLPRTAQRTIIDAVDRLANEAIGDVKKLAGEPGYRLRVGNYRVIFEEHGDVLEIEVLKVGPRKDVYR